MTDYLFRLGLTESAVIVPLQSFGSGTYRYRLGTPGGNSLISFLNVTAVTGSVLVRYIETGLGNGEYVSLGHHDLIESAQDSRVTITRVSTRPIAEIVVTGNATFSLEIVVVSDQPMFENYGNKNATVIHKALDGDLTVNRNAIPSLGFKDDTGAFRYARVNDLSEQVSQSANMEDIIAMTRASQLHTGETYDRLICSDVMADTKIIEYSLSDICQFQIIAKKQGKGFDILKRPCEFFMLKEDGSFLKQENESKLKIHGLIPL